MRWPSPWMPIRQGTRRSVASFAGPVWVVTYATSFVRRGQWFRPTRRVAPIMRMIPIARAAESVHPVASGASWTQNKKSECWRIVALEVRGKKSLLTASSDLGPEMPVVNANYHNRHRMGAVLKPLTASLRVIINLPICKAWTFS